MKKLISIISACLIAASAGLCASAAHISSAETAYPDIKITVDSASGAYKDVKPENITASIGEVPLKAKTAEVKNNSVEWIILADTSKSVSAEHFKAEQKAIIDLYKSLDENDKLSLYTFDTGFNKVLEGTETPEEAAKKVNAIKCDGLDTAFYDVLSKVEDLAKASTADRVIPMIYSDGMDTLSKTTKQEIVKKLKAEKVPIYGMYADVMNEKTVKSFNSILKYSGGKAFAYKVDNASRRLINCNGKADSVNISFTCDQPIPANEAANLTVDLGDGKVLTKTIPVEEYIPESTSEAASETTVAESETEVTTEPTADEEGFDLIKILIPVAAIVLLGVIALIVVKKKGSVKKEKAKVKISNDNSKKSSEADAKKAENALKAEEKKAAAEAKKAEEEAKKAALKEKKRKEKEEQQFQFYFEDKKKK